MPSCVSNRPLGLRAMGTRSCARATARRRYLPLPTPIKWSALPALTLVLSLTAFRLSGAFPRASRLRPPSAPLPLLAACVSRQQQALTGDDLAHAIDAFAA
jgi:hypothetical protein